jgi:MFS transporter, PPP family, 3-phenylpropionic acid transporter
VKRSGRKEDYVVASRTRHEFEGGAGAADSGSSTARVSVARPSVRSSDRPDGFSWRLAAFYAAVFWFSGIILPFFPAWLQAKGLDATATGIVLAVPMLIRLVSVPSVARLADRRSALRGALISSAFGSAAAYLVLSQAVGFLPILLAVALAALATAPTMPLLDAYALRGLAVRGRAYGPVRLWGSVAFVFANFGAGLVIDRIAATQIIWLLFGSLMMVAAVSLMLRPIASDINPAEHVGATGGKLLLSAGFWVFTGGASLIQASHAVYYGFSVLDWRAKGLDAASIGGLWGLAVIAEIALFAVSARFPQRIGSLGLLGVGALGALLRWGVMSFNPPIVLLPMLQLLHAFSFGATHLGSMQLLARHASVREFATAQGDFATVLALVMAGSMALSGALYAELGDRAYAAMALAAALGGVLVLLARNWVTQPKR